MAFQSPPGLQRIKRHITVDAPVECCYRTWLDSAKMPDFMSRLLAVQCKDKPSRPFNLPNDIDIIAPFMEMSPVPYGKIRQWLLAGPGGNLYEYENMVVLEIPNRFYCTTSIDPDDISVQSSVFFSPDGKNEHTYIEWEISFWCLDGKGSGTKLLCDVLMTEDPMIEECLQDFKSHLEGKSPNGKTPNGRPQKNKAVQPFGKTGQQGSTELVGRKKE
jgi:uncharacterized membrane protein